MALVYVADAVPVGNGTRGLSRQGLDRPVTNIAVQARGASGTGALTVRALDDTDQLVFSAHGLPAHETFTLNGIRPDGSAIPLFSVSTTATGIVDQALDYTDFIGVYNSAVLTPALAAVCSAVEKAPFSGRNARMGFRLRTGVCRALGADTPGEAELRGDLSRRRLGSERKYVKRIYARDTGKAGRQFAR